MNASELEGQLPAWDESLDAATVIIAGRSFACAVVQGGVQFVQTERGNKHHQDITLTIRKSLLPDPVALGGKLTYNGHEWTVESMEGDAPGVQSWGFKAHRWID